MARSDHLTGLYNRRGFEEELERELANARRFERSGALLMLDLDGFKAVNDTLGHRRVTRCSAGSPGCSRSSCAGTTSSDGSGAMSSRSS